MRNVQPSTDTRRLESLDVLRAMAAISVLSFHYEDLLTSAWPSGWPSARDQWLHLGLMGVELFFVISGAVILMTLERTTVPSFLVKRLARLYPAYWASVIVSGTFLGLIHIVQVRTIIDNGTMLQSYFGIADIITPYWTLAYELWFYAVMAGIAMIGLLARVDRLALVWLLVVATAKLIHGEFDGRLAIFLMPQFGHLFVAGMMIYRINSGRGTAETILVLCLCALYSLFGRGDWAHVSSVQYFVGNAFFIAIVWAALSNVIGSSLNTPWLVQLGLCSYSLYLFHLPIGMMLVAAANELGQPNWLGVVLAIPSSIVIALLGRRYIELPGQKLIENFWNTCEKCSMTVLKSSRADFG
jgi:peptidoglycan/LPS O-acetylase OafA/YrhL